MGWNSCRIKNREHTKIRQWRNYTAILHYVSKPKKKLNFSLYICVLTPSFMCISYKAVGFIHN